MYENVWCVRRTNNASFVMSFNHWLASVPFCIEEWPGINESLLSGDTVGCPISPQPASKTDLVLPGDFPLSSLDTFFLSRTASFYMCFLCVLHLYREKATITYLISSYFQRCYAQLFCSVFFFFFFPQERRKIKGMTFMKIFEILALGLSLGHFMTRAICNMIQKHQFQTWHSEEKLHKK